MKNKLHRLKLIFFVLIISSSTFAGDTPASSCVSSVTKKDMPEPTPLEEAFHSMFNTNGDRPVFDTSNFFGQNRMAADYFFITAQGKGQAVYPNAPHLNESFDCSLFGRVMVFSMPYTNVESRSSVISVSHTQAGPYGPNVGVSLMADPNLKWRQQRDVTGRAYRIVIENVFEPSSDPSGNYTKHVEFFRNGQKLTVKSEMTAPAEYKGQTFTCEFELPINPEKTKNDPPPLSGWF